MKQFGTHVRNLLIRSNASNMKELLMFYEDGLRLSNIALLTNLHDQHALHEGINLKGCLYLVGKCNSSLNLSKWRVASKIARHVCLEVFFESAHWHVYHSSDVQNYTTREKNTRSQKIELFH